MNNLYRTVGLLAFLGLAGLVNAQTAVLLDQQNLLDGSLGGQGIGRFSDITGDPDPDGAQFDLQDAQSFTVGIDGQLALIKLPIAALSGRTTEDVILEVVRLAADGSPDDMQSLGTVSLPATVFQVLGFTVEDPGFDFDAFIDPSTWAAFGVASLRINVAAGDRLAYSVRTTDTEGYLYNPEFGDDTFLYAGGEGFRRNAAENLTWGTSGVDFGFQVFVMSVPTTEVATEREDALPVEFTLDQNYPNPFNPTTTIEFDLPKAGYTTLKVYNVVGQEVAILVSKDLEAGKYITQFGANNLAGGIYWYRIQVGSFVLTKKMLLMK